MHASPSLAPALACSTSVECDDCTKPSVTRARCDTLWFMAWHPIIAYRPCRAGEGWRRQELEAVVVDSLEYEHRTSTGQGWKC